MVVMNYLVAIEIFMEICKAFRNPVVGGVDGINRPDENATSDITFMEVFIMLRINNTNVKDVVHY